MKIRELVIAALQFTRPVRILEQLVQEDMRTALTNKGTHEIHQRIGREIEVVDVSVQTRTYIVNRFTRTTLAFLRHGFRCVSPFGFDFFDSCQHEIGLSYTTTSLDSYQAVIPVNLVHQLATDGHRSMGYKKIVNPEKRV